VFVSGLDDTSRETTASDSPGSAAQAARRLLDDRFVRDAREVVQDALATGERDPELLWVLADAEFADGNLVAGHDVLAEAFEASGKQPADVARQLRVLRRNLLWREVLLAMEKLPAAVAGHALVRAEIGAFYQSCGCHARAAQGYGPRQGLTSSARAGRRLCWLWSGGPSKMLRERIGSWEDATLLPTLGRRPGYLRQLDTTGLADRQVLRLQFQLETLNYRLLRLSYEANAVLTTGYRLLPLTTPAVWIVMLLVVSQAGFAAGVPAAAGAAAVSACIAVAVVTLLVTLLVTPSGAMRFGIPVPTYRLAGIYVFLVAVFEAAAGEAYIRHVLPTSGWWSWVVLGLTVAPAAVACVPIGGAVLAGLWRFRYLRLVREDGVLHLVDLLLELLDDLRRRDDDQSFGHRLFQARRLEFAARRLLHGLVPSSAAGYLGSGEWLKEKLAGWAEALRAAQHQLIAALPGDKASVEEFLIHEIRCLATSDLGALSWQEPPPPLPRRDLLRRRTITVIRTTLVAGLPLTVVLTAQPLLHLSTTVFDWARVSAGLWALLYIVLSLDPTIGDKVGTAREIASLLRGSPAPGSSSNRQSAASE
jgi:hypothetical protein